jgi:cytochrome c-type biogenesis protein CcmH
MAMFIRQLATLIIALLIISGNAGAVEPDELLANPTLEARARAISAELRCLVCQNQSIDDSNAPLARDLRLLVRERLTAGNSDAEIMRFLIDRYGEFVLLRPRFSTRNAFLWLSPFALLAGVMFILWRQQRSHPARPTVADEARPLSTDESRKLEKILSDDSRR